MPMILPLLLALQVAPGEPYRSPLATVVAEPVALFFAGLDADRDGRTTRAEVKDGIDQLTKGTAGWSNGLGYLAYSDWAERYLGSRTAVPTPFEIDRDGDNKLTIAEFTARIDAIFTRFDTNKDGALTRAELLTIRAGPMGQRPGERRLRNGERIPLPDEKPR